MTHNTPYTHAGTTTRMDLDEHMVNHVGHTCIRGCWECEQDHVNYHNDYNDCNPTYDDCQLCEAAWMDFENSKNA